jgi:hypothetical protein
MTTLLSTTITTAVTAQVTTPLQLREVQGNMAQSIGLQGNFTYGSGGTTADAWVQTSFDGGNSWCDVANFHFTLSSKRYFFNLSSLTPVTTEATPTDGALAANTANDGTIGQLWRVKYSSSGTYAGSTTLRVDANALGLTSSP